MFLYSYKGLECLVKQQLQFLSESLFLFLIPFSSPCDTVSYPNFIFFFLLKSVFCYTFTQTSIFSSEISAAYSNFKDTISVVSIEKIKTKSIIMSTFYLSKSLSRKEIATVQLVMLSLCVREMQRSCYFIMK